MRQHSVDLGLVLSCQNDARYGEVGGKMGAVASTDDDSRDGLFRQHGGTCGGGDVDAVPVGNFAQSHQQCLEKIPAAEIVDDQFVFDQRAVLEGILWFRLTEPAIAEKAACHRAVAE